MIQLYGTVYTSGKRRKIVKVKTINALLKQETKRGSVYVWGTLACMQGG